MDDEVPGPGPMSSVDFEPVDATSDTAPIGAAVFDDATVAAYSQHALDRWNQMHQVNGQSSPLESPDDVNTRGRDAANAAADALDASDPVSSR